MRQMGGSVGIICLLPTSRHMTSTDRNDLTTYRNDLMPAQEKLEWVTPKISLMAAGDTEAKYTTVGEFQIYGPS